MICTVRDSVRVTVRDVTMKYMDRIQWKKVKLGDVSTIFSGFAFKSKDMNNIGGIPLIKIKNINNFTVSAVCDSYLNSNVELGKYERFKLQPNDFLIAMTGQGSVGRVGKMMDYSPIFYVNQRVAIVRPNVEIINPYYLYKCLATNEREKELFNKANGAGQPNISPAQIGDLDLIIPNLPIQHHIATILSRYDSLIENYQKQIKLLEEAAQRLYKEWFVDLHFPGHENTKIIDGVPNGWEKKKIRDFVTFYDKQRKPLSSMQRMDMKKIYPYYGAASLMDYVDNYLFDGIYLLFGEDGTVITPDNHPVLQYVWGKFWVNNHAHVLKGKDSISTEFLYVLFKNITISDVVTGVAQPKISQGRLSDKAVMLPPVSLIEKWSTITESYFCQLRNLSSQIRLLTEARDRLLPKLMSGEIKV